LACKNTIYSWEGFILLASNSLSKTPQEVAQRQAELDQGKDIPCNGSGKQGKPRSL